MLHYKYSTVEGGPRRDKGVDSPCVCINSDALLTTDDLGVSCGTLLGNAGKKLLKPAALLYAVDTWLIHDNAMSALAAVSAVYDDLV